MTTMQSLNCCHVVRMEYHPHLTTYGTGGPCDTTMADGRFPKESLHLPRGVNHKEDNKAKRSLTPENGCGLHFTEINYLFLF
ncbi:neuronal regeneration-related protein-like isoform X2 [Pseudophryne corroboree]|uniref:neuronal regeneration-related protein-like isoform X2 n=1 Tax=Pseudophryne corroboree TaxID=495146 RepID=UPI003081F69A